MGRIYFAVLLACVAGCVDIKSDTGDASETTDGRPPASDGDGGTEDWTDAGASDGVGADDAGSDSDASTGEDGGTDTDSDSGDSTGGEESGGDAADSDDTGDSSADGGSSDTGSPADDADEDIVVDPDAPVAGCSVTPSVLEAITGSAMWDGRASSDPGGSELTYEWTLVYQPLGSAVSMPSGDPSSPIRTGFSPDLAGEYVGRLVVTNAEGVSSPPCEAVLVAEPDAALWVEMFWEHPGDDMDLHLLAPGGTPRTSSDCYFVNCVSGVRDWGLPGITIDNPSLDLDDIPGTGPENINIEEPESGVYTVFVHDYPSSVWVHGNQVTVNIYLDGVLVWADTRLITGENRDLYFAEIDTNLGGVRPL